MTPFCETYEKTVAAYNGKDEENLDAVYSSSEHCEIAVFDGMSSNEKSRLASQKAVETVRSDITRLWLSKPNRENMKEGMKDLFKLIAAEVIRECIIRRIKERIGTTGVMGKYYIDEASGKPTVTCAHVGDSRMYRAREGHLECLTIDHNDLMDELWHKPDHDKYIYQWQDMIDRVATEEELKALIEKFDLSNQEPEAIHRWITIGPSLSEIISNVPLDMCSPRVSHFTVKPKDEYYCVTDGISKNVHPDRFREIVIVETPIAEKGRLLILEAKEHPFGLDAHEDDKSVAILKPIL